VLGSRGVKLVAGGMLLVSCLGACSRDEGGGAPGAASSSSPAVVATAPGSFTTIGAGDSRGDAASPAGEQLARRLGAQLGLEPVVVACLAHRLDGDPGLRDALGDNPATSPRYGEVSGLAAECVRMTTGATDFANGLQAQAGGRLSSDQLGCLRDAYAKLSPQDVTAIVQSGLYPGSTETNVSDKVPALLSSCGVDQNVMPPP
jgi:hypothetical protein